MTGKSDKSQQFKPGYTAVVEHPGSYRERLREHFDYSTMAAFISAVENPNLYRNPRTNDASHRPAFEEWNGEPWTGRDATGQPCEWSGAVALARAGWSGPVADIRAATARLSRRVGSMLHSPQYVPDVTGDTFDVGEYLAGTPECWSRVEPKPVRARGNIVRIALNAAVSCGVDASVIVRRGTAIASLVSLLERQGYRAEVSLVYAVATDYPKAGIQTARVVLKSAATALDLPRLAFSLAHPAMVRRLMFRLTEAATTYYGAHGIPTSYPGLTDYDVALDRVHFDDPQWRTTEATEAWVIETLQAQGVRFDRNRLKR